MEILHDYKMQMISTIYWEFLQFAVCKYQEDGDLKNKLSKQYLSLKLFLQWKVNFKMNK